MMVKITPSSPICNYEIETNLYQFVYLEILFTFETHLKSSRRRKLGRI